MLRGGEILYYLTSAGGNLLKVSKSQRQTICSERYPPGLGFSQWHVLVQAILVCEHRHLPFGRKLNFQGSPVDNARLLEYITNTATGGKKAPK